MRFQSKIRGISLLILVFGVCLMASCNKDKKATPDPPVEETPDPPKPDLPEITSISPDAADTGVVVIITGKYFGTELSKVSVLFGDVVVVPDSLSDTKIVTKSPDHAPGTLKVVVKVGDLVSKSIDFTYNKPITDNAFKEDASGWTIIGDAQGGYVAASYAPAGGVVDGYIYAKDDVLGGVWYFNAPSSYLGDKSDYYNAKLKFSLYQHSSMKNQFENTDIIFESGNKRISCQLPAHPDSSWTAYSFKINSNAGWVNGDYPSKDTASEADMKSVLSNVTGFYIRGEFETGPDRGGMDNIEIIKVGN